MAVNDVQGVVTDSNGDPVQGATVYALRTDSSPPVMAGEDTTNASGEFTITTDFGGEVHVTAQWESGGVKYSSDSSPFITVQKPTTLRNKYNPSSLSLNEGEVIDPFTDLKGDSDLSAGGSPTYNIDSGSGEAVARYDGTSYHSITEGSFPDLQQPLTVMVAYRSFFQGDYGAVITRAGFAAAQYDILWDTAGDSPNWRTFAGNNQVTGSDTSAPLVLTVILDGGQSKIRENGVETGSGDAGTNGIESVTVGGLRESDTFGKDADMGELLFFDSNLESEGELDNEEQRLADKYGITLS